MISEKKVRVLLEAQKRALRFQMDNEIKKLRKEFTDMLNLAIQSMEKKETAPGKIILKGAPDYVKEYVENMKKERE